MAKWYPLICLGVFSITAHAQESGTPISDIKIQSVQFEEAELTSVLEFLSVKARELGARPSNFLVYDPTGSVREADPRITLALKNIPFSEVIKYTTKLSETDVLVDPHAVVIGKRADLGFLKQLRKATVLENAGLPYEKTLRKVRVTSISFDETPFPEAIEFLREVGKGQGVPSNFVIKNGLSDDLQNRTVTMSLAGIPLRTALQYTAEAAGAAMRFDPRAVVLAPHTDIGFPPQASAMANPQFDILENTVIENISIEDATIPEVIEVLAYYCKDPKVAPDGPNFLLMAKSDRTVTLHLQKNRAIDVLQYMNEQTRTMFRVESRAIVIQDQPPAKKKDKPADDAEKP